MKRILEFALLISVRILLVFIYGFLWVVLAKGLVWCWDELGILSELFSIVVFVYAVGYLKSKKEPLTKLVSDNWRKAGEIANRRKNK